MTSATKLDYDLRKKTSGYEYEYLKIIFRLILIMVIKFKSTDKIDQI